jgi:hypothetical protein
MMKVKRVSTGFPDPSANVTCQEPDPSLRPSESEKMTLLRLIGIATGTGPDEKVPEGNAIV